MYLQRATDAQEAGGDTERQVTILGCSCLLLPTWQLHLNLNISDIPLPQSALFFRFYLSNRRKMFFIWNLHVAFDWLIIIIRLKKKGSHLYSIFSAFCLFVFLQLKRCHLYSRGGCTWRRASRSPRFLSFYFILSFCHFVSLSFFCPFVFLQLKKYSPIFKGRMHIASCFSISPLEPNLWNVHFVIRGKMYTCKGIGLKYTCNRYLKKYKKDPQKVHLAEGYL